MSSPYLSIVTILLGASALSAAPAPWKIDTAKDWETWMASSRNLESKDGCMVPTAKQADLKTKVRRFDTRRSADLLTIRQSPLWQNWTPAGKVGPVNLRDAPVFLTMGPGNYWLFGLHAESRRSRKRSGANSAFQPEPTTLEGFDLPLQTTRHPNQFDAPGGLKPSKGGYHAWQSHDMKHWVHHGPVTERFSKWVTSAEMVDGKVLIYYDFPNDQDPHVYVDDDLFDGEPGENLGKVLDDPSNGSDAGFIRGLDGKVHAIFEDWSAINASKRSWDAPMAGHAVSPNGIDPFRIQNLAIDQRTTPTGKIATYRHPHWVKEDPEHYTTNLAEYEVHKPEQPAYGDWAAISIGGRYYLFGDYDPAEGQPMSVGWWTSPSIDQPFSWCGHIGRGHPDPDVGFAEGRFYLITQMRTDYVSPGPWVESVKARVGVDHDDDGNINEWTPWSEVRESYHAIPGFAKQVERIPATLDLSGLAAGFRFQIEMKLVDQTDNPSQPMIDQLELSFE